MNVRIKRELPSPGMPTDDPAAVLVVVGAAELDKGPHAVVVAVLVRMVGPGSRGPRYAVWWDRDRSGLVADRVDE